MFPHQFSREPPCRPHLTGEGKRVPKGHLLASSPAAVTEPLGGSPLQSPSSTGRTPLPLPRPLRDGAPGLWVQGPPAPTREPGRPWPRGSGYREMGGESQARPQRRGARAEVQSGGPARPLGEVPGAQRPPGAQPPAGGRPSVNRRDSRPECRSRSRAEARPTERRSCLTAALGGGTGRCWVPGRSRALPSRGRRSWEAAERPRSE